MRLNYKQFGDGRPVVIIHGLLGMLDNWQTLARKLGEEYHVITPDMRNHGRSPHSAVFTYESMAADVIALLDDLAIQQAQIIGHSMGGKVAMTASLAYPQRVGGLVSIDMAPKEYAPAHDNIMDSLAATDPSNMERRSDVEEALLKKLGDIRIVRFLMKNLGRDSDGNFIWKMNLATIRAQYENILRGITSNTPYDKPSLFIRGGDSHYVGEEDLDAIKVLFPHATLETIEDAGHWLHADKPEETLGILRQFLAATPSE